MKLLGEHHQEEWYVVSEYVSGKNVQDLTFFSPLTNYFLWIMRERLSVYMYRLLLD